MATQRELIDAETGQKFSSLELLVGAAAAVSSGESILLLSDAADDTTVPLVNITVTPLLTVADVVVPAGYVAVIWISIRFQLSDNVTASVNGDFEGHVLANGTPIAPDQQIRTRLLTGASAATDTNILQAGQLLIGPEAGTYTFVLETIGVFGASSANVFQSRMTIFAVKLTPPPP